MRERRKRSGEEAARATTGMLSKPPGEGIGPTVFRLLAVVCLLALALTACKPPPHSSPTALRNTNDYAKAIAPVAPRALDLQALDQITVTREGDSLVVTTGAGVDEANDGFEHVVDYLKAGIKLVGAGADFELVALAASGPGVSKTVTNQNKTIPLDCFGPDGRRLAAEELKALGFKDWELSEASIGSCGGVDYAFPNLRASLGSIKQPPGYYTVVGVFDARTKKSLASGFSYSGIASNNLGHVNVHAHAWHATPMELVLDVELDGETVVETNVVPGMRLAVPGGEVRLLGVWDGYTQSWSSQSGGAGSPSTLRLALAEREGEPRAVAVFVTEPPKLAVHVDLLDDRGKVFVGYGGGTAGAIRMAGWQGHAADAKQVRFTVYTNHHRVVLTLPPIPNLPGVGQPVANLFDVRLPRVQIKTESELRDIIGDMTQFHFGYPPGGDGMPKALFPLSFTNATAGDLLVRYRQELTNHCTVVVDEVKQEIWIEPTPFEKVKRWVQQKLP